MKNTLYLALLILGLGCKNISDATRTSKLDPRLVLAFATSTSQSASSTETWNGLCKKLTIRFLNSTGGAVSLPVSRTLNFTSTTGTVYSGPDCSTSAITEYEAAAGSSSATVYYKTLAISGTDSLTAELSSEESASLTVEVISPSIDIFLGQASVTGNAVTCNLDASEFCDPAAVVVAEGRVMVNDGRHRILIWNTNAPANGSAADRVLGQPDFNTGAPATTQQGLRGPWSLASAGSKLFVADGNNHRVMVWDPLPTVDEASATSVIGQPDFVTGTANTGGISGARLYAPQDVATDGSNLVIADGLNQRVLLWNTIPTNDAAADFVLGQADMVSSAWGVSSTRMNTPSFVCLHDGKILVSDRNNRVLIWNALPAADDRPADVVLGQPDFTSSAANQGGTPSASTLSSPAGIKVDEQGRLFIADYNNDRVLVWNQIPTTNGAPADAVIGQSSFSSVTGGASATKINGPWNLAVDGNYLWIVDFDNNRVVRLPIP